MNNAINTEAKLGGNMYQGIDTKHPVGTPKWYEANGFGTEFTKPTAEQSAIIKKGLAQVQTTVKLLLAQLPKDSSYAIQVVEGLRYAFNQFKGGIVGHGTTPRSNA